MSKNQQAQQAASVYWKSVAQHARTEQGQAETQGEKASQRASVREAPATDDAQKQRRSARLKQ